MFGHPQSYKVFSQQYENRHANAGSLLAMLFLPYLAITARSFSYSNVTVCSLMLVYSALVLPLASGYTRIGTLLVLAKRGLFSVVTGGLSLLQVAAKHLRSFNHEVHSTYLRLKNIHTITNQVIFNLAAEKLLCPGNSYAYIYISCIYVSVACLHESFKMWSWKKVFCKISSAELLRLTKSFVLNNLDKVLLMGMLLGVHAMQSSPMEMSGSYATVTLLYFLLTQYAGVAGEVSCLVASVQKLNLYELEGLEEWWLPTITRALSIAMSAVLLPLLLLRLHWILAAFLGYTNVLVPWRLLMEQCWAPLVSQRQATARFPLPSLRQLRDRVCPVCLEDMRLLSARVTPCQHVLHAYCLRKCIQSFHQCPLCKHPL